MNKFEEALLRYFEVYFYKLNILPLDFDSGGSDVNVTNRLPLFIDNLRHKQQDPTAEAAVG